MGKITVILCTLDVILMALSVVLYLDEDRTAPVIHMEEAELEYRDGMNCFSVTLRTCRTEKRTPCGKG